LGTQDDSIQGSGCSHIVKVSPDISIVWDLIQVHIFIELANPRSTNLKRHLNESTGDRFVIDNPAKSIQTSDHVIHWKQFQIAGNWFRPAGGGTGVGSKGYDGTSICQAKLHNETTSPT
jgi:hypothetical protein